jgi:hypothetical protein
MVKTRRSAPRHEPLPVGVDSDTFAARFPRLYHMAEPGSWEGIRRHGLLSTSALLDLFEVSGDTRERIESQRRRESVMIEHTLHGRAVIRDQKPMDDRGLMRALGDGITPRQWYELLNRHVFFWVSEVRLNRLLRARAYRSKQQMVLTLLTRPLLERYADNVVLSPMNSGATKPYPFPRGLNTFLPMSEYPLAEWDRKRRRTEPVVEVAVRHGVRYIDSLVERVTLAGGDRPTEIIWQRA